MATIPPDDSKEALESEMDRVPPDKAMQLTPDIKKRFDDFVKKVYPGLVTTSRQYIESEMVWHAAYLDMLDVLSTVVTAQDEDTGVWIIHCLIQQCSDFMKDYQKRVHGKEQQSKEEK